MMVIVDICDLNLIGVIGGTGQFGRAICKRLIASGYHVIVGSRKPDKVDMAKRDPLFQDTRLCSIEECITLVNTLILCVRKKHFNTLLPFQTILSGKVVIDATNQDRRDRNESNADYLRTMFPEAVFCKAFNTISAYNMSPNEYCQEGIRIPVACDNTIVRHAVCEMIRYMGFTPMDYGRLHLAKNLEKAPLRILSGWGGSFLFGMSVFFVWLLHGMLIYFIRAEAPSEDRNFLKVCSKASAMSSITLLSTTYLAGAFASFTQIKNGTRRKTFDRWLDKWLHARKSLGLISMLFALIHVFATFIIMGPTTYKSWFMLDKENNLKMIWEADIALFTGIICFIVLGCVAISAIPSVSESVNWREWRFLQTWMGYGALVIGIVHITFAGSAFWINMSPSDMFMAVPFHSIILPTLTVILKLILVLPCVSGYLNQIREGIDFEQATDITETSETSATGKRISSRRRSDAKEKSTSYPEWSVTDETDRTVKEKSSRDKPREGRDRVREEGGTIRERSREPRDRKTDRGSTSRSSKPRTQQSRDGQHREGQQRDVKRTPRETRE